MKRCEIWGLVQCPRLAVDSLVFLNPNINWGELLICEQHLTIELREHCLERTR